MSTTVLTAPLTSARRLPTRAEATWGLVFCLPYLVLFIALVVFPVCYGFWLGSGVESYRRLWNDPVYARTLFNTILFLGVAVNLKMALALLISGFFMVQRVWIRWLSVLFVLPWAVPSIPTILSFKWMLNDQWGMINQTLWTWFGIENPPGWLVQANLAMGAIIVVHIWKYLPFWTLVMLAARMAIPRDLYEAALVDGASGLQRFRFITFPGVRNIYITSTLLSTIWTLGDFNSVYLLTGGAPVERTHVLATLGFRYAFRMSDIGTGIATVITALPFLIPMVLYLMIRLGRKTER
jgi:multiple sugar transport system permease protein